MHHMLHRKTLIGELRICVWWKLYKVWRSMFVVYLARTLHIAEYKLCVTANFTVHLQDFQMNVPIQLKAFQNVQLILLTVLKDGTVFSC